MNTHAEEARKLLGRDREFESIDAVELSAGLDSVTHAVLELAEKQSIANFISQGETMKVHNHGPEEGRGIDCGEPRLTDGSFIGWCQILPIIRKAKEQAWDEGFSAGYWDAKTPNPYTEES